MPPEVLAEGVGGGRGAAGYPKTHSLALVSWGAGKWALVWYEGAAQLADRPSPKSLGGLERGQGPHYRGRQEGGLGAWGEQGVGPALLELAGCSSPERWCSHYAPSFPEQLKHQMTHSVGLAD